MTFIKYERGEKNLGPKIVCMTWKNKKNNNRLIMFPPRIFY